jgi:hypothetical protein
MNTQSILSVDTSTLIAGISRGSIIVDLAISTYTGRKQDKRTQAEVTLSKGANSKRAASVYKSLFADCKELDDITKFQARVRQTHYRLTQPWNDFGSRLLPTSLLKEYKSDMNRLENEFNTLVTKFLDKYDTLVSAAAFQLGTLFDRSEYPLRPDVARKFSINIDYTPLPTSGDFRLDLEHDVQVEMAQRYEAKAQARLAAAAQDSWTRLHTALTRLSDRLTTDVAEDGTPKKRIFHDTMVNGAVDLCDLLKHMNIMGDSALEKARVQLEAVLSGVTPKDLRDSEGTRIITKQKVDAILDAFDWGDDDSETAEPTLE